MPRASDLSAVRMAPTSSCITPPSRATASVRFRKVSAFSSMSSRAPRAGRQRTFRLSNRISAGRRGGSLRTAPFAFSTPLPQRRRPEHCRSQNTQLKTPPPPPPAATVSRPFQHHHPALGRTPPPAATLFEPPRLWSPHGHHHPRRPKQESPHTNHSPYA